MPNEVYIPRPHTNRPTFHRVPDWHSGEGWDGDVVKCNTFVYKGTTRLVGSNDGRDLPAQVKAPCGVVVLRRTPPEARRPGLGNYEILNDAYMTSPSYVAVTLRRDHAEKFGRPCKRCFP
jgi:hypothetical protein